MSIPYKQEMDDKRANVYFENYSGIFCFLTQHIYEPLILTQFKNYFLKSMII